MISDLDYIRGIHSYRAGVDVTGGQYRSDETSNYLGTFTFESLDDYNAGTPRSYTRRTGNPDIRYSSVQAGIYVQDDIRVRKNLTLSPGIRYELQNHLDDFNNFAPRFGLNWAPFKSGKTTIRASAGIFYDWFSSSTYEQTIRLDGFRQQELNIFEPSFPDPGQRRRLPHDQPLPDERERADDGAVESSERRVPADADSRACVPAPPTPIRAAPDCSEV